MFKHIREKKKKKDKNTMDYYGQKVGNLSCSVKMLTRWRACLTERLDIRVEK